MENTQEKKKIVLSCIQPTGTPTLGNYLGALKNWANMCDDYNCLYGVADLHSITVPTFRDNPQQLKKNTLELYALLLALGIDPEKNVVFVQSHVPTHAQLCWILNCYTQFGEASRMTQFKDKKQKQVEGELILKYITPSTDMILLDERGTEFRSIEFADYIQKKMSSGRDVVFVVGGPYGFSESVYQRANAKISLSKMTFSHQMVRLFFVEQIYRAMTILRSEPYHHE